MKPAPKKIEQLERELQRALRALQLARGVLGSYSGERNKKKRIAIATAEYVLHQHNLKTEK